MKVPNLEALIEESEKASMEEEYLTQQAEYMGWATEHLRVAEEALKQVHDPAQYWRPQKQISGGYGSQPLQGTTWVYTAETINATGGNPPQLNPKSGLLDAPLIEHSVRYIK